MTGGSVAPCTRAWLPLADAACHTRSVANGARDGDGLPAAGRVPCVTFPVSESMDLYQCDRFRDVSIYFCRMRASYGYLNTMETLETG